MLIATGIDSKVRRLDVNKHYVPVNVSIRRAAAPPAAPVPAACLTQTAKCDLIKN